MQTCIINTLIITLSVLASIPLLLLLREIRVFQYFAFFFFFLGEGGKKTYFVAGMRMSELPKASSFRFNKCILSP